MTTTLRALAIALVALAALDPAVPATRHAPVVLDVRLGRAAGPDAADAASRLRGQGRRAGAQPGGMVLIDPAAEDLTSLPPDLPVSIVRTGDERLRIEQVEPVAPVLPGQLAVVRARLVASGLGGREIHVVLERDGLPVDQATLAIEEERQRFAVELSFVPPSAGLHVLRVSARAQEDLVAHVDVGVLARAQGWRVLVLEPRPSWAATFVRRVLEEDPAFEVALVSRSSRGVAVRSGRAPERVTADALARYDVVVAGAPELLAEAEVRALEAFTRRRGGAVLFLPDRLPTGPYARRLPAARFQESLLERPIEARGAGGALIASELALPVGLPAGVATLADAATGAEARPLVVGWRAGDGQMIFSGALDAWRHRARENATYSRFWTSLVLDAARQAPPPLDLEAHPRVAAPGAPVRVRARLRGDLLDATGADAHALAAAIVAPDGRRSHVRLWPTSEAGVFEGTVEPTVEGRMVVQAIAGRRSAETPFVVGRDIRPWVPADEAIAADVARATGGIVVPAARLDQLETHLAGVTSEVGEPLRPMRAAWWLLAAVGALCGEWALRRRRGLR